MSNIEKDVMAGSIIETVDHTLWFSCGNWQLSGILEAFPSIPAYVLESKLPQNVEKTKRIVSSGRNYVKVFGHHGLPLTFHREWLYPKMGDLIYPFSLGRMVFVRKDSTIHVKNPILFRQKLLSELPDAKEIYSSLIEVLGIPMECVGISGSVLAIGVPSWRHETDISIYGREACSLAFTKINEARKKGIFSMESIPPYHMPFQYKGKWFDPHFSAVERELYLQGAVLNVISNVGETTFTITDDKDGLFYPVVYIVNGTDKLVSFRSSHRGLYRNGDQVLFSSLSKAELVFPNGKSEEVFLVANDEWGEILQNKRREK